MLTTAIAANKRLVVRSGLMTLVVRGPATVDIEEMLDVQPAEAGFTAQENEVFEKMRRNLCNKEIATDLGVEVRTVKFHVTNVLRKLDCESRAEVVLKYGGRDS